MLLPIDHCFIKKGLNILEWCTVDDPVSGSDAHAAIGSVKGIDQPADFGAYIARRSFLQDMLYIKASQESEPISVFPGNFDFIHGTLLYGVEDIDASLDQIIEKGCVITAGVQPPVNPVRLEKLTDSLVIGKEKLVECVLAHKRLSLVAEVIGCPEAIWLEFTDCQLEVSLINGAEGIVKLVNFLGVYVKIH